MPDQPIPPATPGHPDAPPAGASAARPLRIISADHADLVRAALVVVFVLLGLQLLWAARILALTAFLGVLFGLGASPAVDALERRGIRRGVGSPLIIFGALGLIIALTAWSAPTLVSQSQELRTRFPEAIQKAEVWLANNQPRMLDLITGTTTAPGDGTTAGATAGTTADSAAKADADSLATPAKVVASEGRLADAILGQAGKLKAVALGILTSTLAAFGGLMLVLFLAVYIAAEPDLYKRGLLALMRPQTRARLDPVLGAIAVKLRRWLSTQAVAMLVIGSVTTIILTIIGVRAAVPLGVIAGILEFIPNIGPTLSAIPAIAMAFVDSPQKALVVVGAYWGIQFLENNLLIPYLMKEQLDLPPALTMMTQVVMAYVFGLMGLFVATPLLAAIFVAVQMLHVTPAPAPAPTSDAETPA
jgi:predicted PurR-regulated permease PerM